MTLQLLLPDVDALLSLELQELAGYVLEDLNSLPATTPVNRGNYTDPSALGYPRERTDVAQAVMEAWVWLEQEGLISVGLISPDSFVQMAPALGKSPKTRTSS